MAPDDPPPQTVGYFCIGRYWCPKCDQVKVCVRDAEATLIVCDCGAVCDVATGDE